MKFKIGVIFIQIIKALLVLGTVFSIIIFWESDIIPIWVTAIVGIIVLTLIRSINSQKVTSFFRSNNISRRQKPDIEKLLLFKNTTTSIIELDDYICELCVHGDALDKLNEPQKNFYYNQNLEREINNGGFNQYFFNSSGEFAHETVVSLRAIGANKTAKILQSAIERFPKGKVPKDEAKRRASLEQLEAKYPEVFEEMDQMFYKYEDDLNQLNMEYVRLNKGEFF